MVILYIIGIIVAFIAIMWFEWKYETNNNLKNLTKKEVMQDVIISLFSWLAVILVIMVSYKKNKDMENV